MMRYFLFFFFALASVAQAALVGPNGYQENFSTQPGAGDWSTYSIGGSSTSSGVSNDLVNAAQALNAADINVALGADGGNPPGATGNGVWSSSGGYVQTRPTGNNGTVLMLRLQNQSGSAVSRVSLTYDYIKATESGEQIPGFLVLYSTSGLAGNWVVVPELSLAGPGRLSASWEVNWPVGGQLYVMWVDDNADGITDEGNQIDNVVVSVVSAVQVPAVVTRSPTNVVVGELGRVELVGGASGNPAPGYQWYREGEAVVGATGAVWVVEEVPLSWNGSRVWFVAQNVVSNVTQSATSAVAVVTVRADTNAPVLLGAYAEGLNLVQLIFNESISSETATNVANYAITSGGGNLVVSNAAVGSAKTNILLTVSRMTENVTYTVRVNNLRDRSQAGNLLAANSTATFVAVSFNQANVGSTSALGAYSTVSGGYNVTAGGSDINSTSDQFFFVYQQRTGDFDVSVRVANFSPSDVWAKAGLMARENLNANAAFAASVATPGAVGVLFLSRTAAGGSVSMSGGQPVNHPYTYLRLKRFGSVFTGFVSYDGLNWVQTGTATIGMPSTIYFGLATASRSTNRQTQVEFRELASVVNPQAAQPRLTREPPGPSSRKTPVAITEIMYKPGAWAGTNDLEFVEIYNSNPYFEDLSNWRLAGDIGFRFPTNFLLGGNEYLVIAKDPDAVRHVYGITNVMGPYEGRLAESGRVRLRTEIDAIVLEVNYRSETPWPAGADGTGHSLVLACPSYGEDWAEAWDISAQVGGSPGRMDGLRQTARHNVVINEFLAHTDLPAVDFIELYNRSTQPVDISGCALSDNPSTNKYIFPPGTTLPARGFLVLTETALGFALDAGGETIYFRNAEDNAVLDCVRFKGQANGVSSGRFPDGASDIYPLQAQTPGTNNNAIRIHDLVINEVMYKPLSELEDDEYVELHNQGTNAWNLAGWRLRDGIAYTFPANTVIPAGGYLVVAKNRTNLLDKYPGLNPAIVLGNYSGSLANRGERLALAMPDQVWTISTNAQGQTVTNFDTIYVDVDEVAYRRGGQWGKWANGGGSSLELKDPRANHRLAANWADSDETQKAPWCTVEFTGPMDHGAQTASHFEVLSLEAGEFLVDNVAVLNTSGQNLISTADSNFETGGPGWLMRGNHARSTVDTSGGEGGGRCLHVRASGRGDTLANRCLVPLTTVPSSGTFTLRARVRWLCGWPEMLVRLHGNYIEASRRLEIPTNLGTPGARNSRYETNAAPAIYEVSYAPVLPAANEAVVVTARVHDPDGVTNLVLRYRLDTAGSYTSVTMVDNGTGGDAVAGDGLYSATIAGQASGALVAYQISATDLRGRNAVFPAGSGINTREHLVRFGELQPVSSFGTYRMYFTQNAVNSWINRPVLSNEPVEGTMVYGNFRVIHHIGARYAGSPYHQGFNSPVGNNCHYSVELPEDDLMLGTENFNKLHGPGNGSFDDPTLQREQVAYAVARYVGLPWLYRRYVAVYVNGVRRGTFMEDMQTPNGDVIEQYWPDDPDGQLYKLQPWFEQNDVASGASSPVNNQSWCTLNAYYSQGQHKLARYRHNYLTRAAKGTANDYTNVFQLVEAASQTGSAFVSAMEPLVDTEQWLKTFAVEHAVGNWDSFGNRNAQNMYGYKGDVNKWRLIIFDLNIVLNSPNDGGTESDAPGAALFQYNSADMNMPKFYNTPIYRRAYWRGLKQVCLGPFSNPRLNDFMDVRYQAFVLNGQTSVRAPSAVKTFISSARASILNQIAAEDAASFSVQAIPSSQNTNLLVIRGQAPVDIFTITINGKAYPINWTSVRDWSVNYVLNSGSNSLLIEGRDAQGNPIPGMEISRAVTFTGTPPDPQNTVMFSEIMYNAAVTNAEYVEIYNASTNVTFDLAGWRVNGLGYDFPLGALLLPQQRLILAKDRAAFTAAYGSGISVFDVFPGNLQKDGETLTLFRPGTNGQEIVVDRVRYEPNLPWSLKAAGGGAALQLVDGRRDHSRPLNWADGQGWKFKYFSLSNRATLNWTNLYFQLSNAGEVWVDDLRVEEGTEVGGGTNYVVNGDFEAPLEGTWVKGTMTQPTVRDGSVSRSGQYSLRLVATGRVTQAAQSLSQPLVLKTGMTYTVSLWYLPSDSVSNLTVYVTAFVTSNFVVHASMYGRSPGLGNPVEGLLPELPGVYLNEVQAENGAGGGWTTMGSGSRGWSCTMGGAMRWI
ncbi:lamin tail domain-containing protein [Fontisphaera persica]|uniref:lamin tail domain-containing protein n=1 Tax=Fontisphaera persica TaxID=2974023 RepID=UPI0024BF4032|nr:lamin tail domain-containing protein [Fontisphaera persica]WCJ60031.1 lamin tail domain-containing protein [Fontisphaera persica]